jgi:amino acid transporter
VAGAFVTETPTEMVSGSVACAWILAAVGAAVAAGAVAGVPRGAERKEGGAVRAAGRAVGGVGGRSFAAAPKRIVPPLAASTAAGERGCDERGCDERGEDRSRAGLLGGRASALPSGAVDCWDRRLCSRSVGFASWGARSKVTGFGRQMVRSMMTGSGTQPV